MPNKNPAEKPNKVNLKTPSNKINNLVKALMGIYELFLTFLRNLHRNKQTLSVILQKFWQKTNLKMLIESVYTEMKTKYIIRYIIGLMKIKAYKNIRKTNGNSGIATVSVNPNARSTRAAAISINPARRISKANASGEEEYTVKKIQ